MRGLWVVYSWFRFVFSVILHKTIIVLVGRCILHPRLPRGLRLSWRRLAVHDLSKFRPSEFFGYAAFLYGPKSSDEERARAKRRFDQVCKLHYSRNEHHPEFFQRRDKSVIANMTNDAIAEMAVDMFAAFTAYNFVWPRPGKWPYLKEDLPRKNMHPVDRLRLAAVLCVIGFEVDVPWFDWRAASTTISDSGDQAALAHLHQLERAYHQTQGHSSLWLWLTSW